MRQKEFESIRRKFNDFVDEFSPIFSRRDRLSRCSQYVAGLMLDGERKSIEPMAERLGNVSARSLQDFMVQETWDADALMDALSRRSLGKHEEPGVLILDDTSLPKQGNNSVGVAHQYCGALGKVANCQSIVSWHWAGKKTHFPIIGRLYLPQSWIDDQKKLDECGVPKSRRIFKTKWRIALDLLAPLASERNFSCICFDAGYGEIPQFYNQLDKLGHKFVGQIPKKMGFWPENLVVDLNPEPGKTGRPYKHPKVADKSIKPRKAEEFTKELSPQADRWKKILTPSGEEIVVSALRVRQAITGSYRCPGPERWLLIERLNDGDCKYYVSNLPDDTTLEELVRFAKSRWKIEQGYQQLKEELGLDHYEGRKWSGLHHHIALCFMAFHFLNEMRNQPTGTGIGKKKINASLLCQQLGAG